MGHPAWAPELRQSECRGEGAGKRGSLGPAEANDSLLPVFCTYTSRRQSPAAADSLFISCFLCAAQVLMAVMAGQRPVLDTLSTDPGFIQLKDLYRRQVPCSKTPRILERGWRV